MPAPAISTSWNTMSLASVLGSLAGMITVVSFVPQVVMVWRTRRTRDLSFGAFALLASGAFLWFVYGVLIGAWPVIVTNGLVAVLVGAILVAKLRFDSLEQPESSAERSM
jgi:MtN3 and saliva related transmembrane protein